MWHCIRYLLNLLTFNFFNINLILIVPLWTPISIKKTMVQSRCNICVRVWWFKCCRYCCLGRWGHCWFYCDFSHGCSCSSKLYYLFNLTIFPLFLYSLTVQGVLEWTDKSKGSLTDKNMQVRFCVKVSLKSWDWGIFEITTNFYEILIERPLLDQM